MQRAIPSIGILFTALSRICSADMQQAFLISHCLLYSILNKFRRFTGVYPSSGIWMLGAVFSAGS